MPNSTTETEAKGTAGKGKTDETDKLDYATLTLSNYLGILREDAFDERAFAGLAALIEQRDSARLGDQPLRLLERARQGHEARGEVLAVAKLIEAEAQLVTDDQAFCARLWSELGRLQAESLLNPDAARAAYQRALELKPDDAEIEEALRKLDQEAKNWRKLIKHYEEELAETSEAPLKASLLTSCAALTWQHKKKGRSEEAEKLLRSALAADRSHKRAVSLLEHMLRERERVEPLAELLLDAAEHAPTPRDQIALYGRAARVLAQKLDAQERAVACYERVIDLEPGNAEAMTFLSEHFGKQERWEDLVALYEQVLAARPSPEVQQAMLLQIGLVHYRMRGKPEDAEPAFARLRRLDPLHPAMLDFYRERAESSGRIDEWIAILADAQRVAQDDKQRAQLALQHGRAALARPDLRDRAIESFRLAQRLDPGNREISAALRELYLKAEKWNALADVIKADVERIPDEEAERKVEALRELLTIYRDRLHMDGMVIGTLGRILKLMPGDQSALNELATRYEGTGRFNELIAILSDRADALTDKSEKVDGYLRVARLWIERFQNYNQATVPYEKVLELDPMHREALSQLRGIYEKKRAWKQLYEVLKRERTVASDPSVRLSATIEMAKLASDRLQSYGDAITLWKEALDQDARAPGAVDALQKLAERDRDYATLAELLEREASTAEAAEDRVRALQKLATLQAEHLSNPKAALAAWRRILEIEPKHGRALRAVRDALIAERNWDELEKVYAGASDFEGLADVLSQEADRAAVQDGALKVELSFRAARVLEERIGEPLRAVRSYERVLGIDPHNVRAATALSIVYTQEEKWGRLRAMLDVMLRAAQEPAAKLSLLLRLRELCLIQLREGEAALAYAAQAYELAADDPATVSALESAAEAAAGWETVVELYAARATTLSGRAAVDLHRRAAEIARDKLGRPKLAAEQWRHVVKLEPTDHDALAQLERVYRSENDQDALYGLLQHRLTVVTDDGQRMRTLQELASIEERLLGDTKAALSRYRDMSALEPENREVLAARDRLATLTEAHQELGEVLERRLEVEQETGARVELGTRLGLLLLDKLGKAEQALAVLETVLERDPAQSQALSALERIGEQQPAHALRVMRVLSAVHEKTGRFDKLLTVLGRMIELSKDENEKHRLRLRMAEISAARLGDTAGAYGALEAAFFERPAERALWERLADAAARAGQQRSLALAYRTALEAGDLGDEDASALAERAAQLYDEVLGLPEEAEPLHKRVLATDPLNERAFLALKELYTSAERWEELQALYRRRIEDTLDAGAKLELLLQLCFLFEEILEQPEHAIEAYEQVLKLDPDHAATRRTLERLYEGAARHRDLFELLRGNLDRAEGPERVDLMFRLGDLCEHKLGEPAGAVEHYERVLEEQPHHLRAQQALSRLLAVSSQRQHIASVLAPLYESQGAYTELASVLEIQLDALEQGPERSELSLRIGELHEQRTRDLDAAITAYARAVEDDPENTRARAALAELAATRDSYRQRRAQVLRRAVDTMAGKNASVESELLLELSVLLDQYLSDPEGAERAYERLIELDPGNADVVLIASRALERIHIESGNHAKLAVDLRRQVELETEPAARGRLLVRLALLLEETLDDPKGAIEAHVLRVEQDPAEVDALSALERLYERTERLSELVQTLRAHSEVTSNLEERRTLLRRAGALLEERLGDATAAIDTYKDLCTSLGPDRETLSALCGLLERAERYDELLESLTELEALTAEPAARSQLRFKLAELLRTQAGESERALDFYEQVLEVDPTHAGSLAALDAVMAGDERELRARAARIAIPCHERGASFERLVSVLEVLEAAEEAPSERVAALRRAAEVTENALHDGKRAFALMVRAVQAGKEESGVTALLGELDRLAELAGTHAEQVSVLQEIATEVYDGELKAEIHRRTARVAEEKLEDLRLALQSHEKVLEERPEDAAALDAIERLNLRLGDFKALLSVLARKEELARDAAEREQLSFRRAELLEQKLENRAGAISVLEDLLVDRPVARAYVELERMLSAEARYDDLVALLEQQLDRQVGVAADVRFKLGKVLHERSGDTMRGIEHLRDCLIDAPDHAAAIALLEALMAEPGEPRTRAAEILEPVYLARMQWAKLTAALEARIEGEDDDAERERLLTRLGQLFEDQLEDFDGAFGVYARLFALDPRDLGTWETLGRLAKVTGRWDRLVDVLTAPVEKEDIADEAVAGLAKHAGKVAVDRTGDHARAARCFAKALAFDPSDREAFELLEREHRALDAWQELLPLYTEQVERADGDDVRIALLHKRAVLERDRASDTSKAVQTYREILELRPDDRAAVSALESLLSGAERFSDLAEHLRERIDYVAGTAEENELRLRLAELLEQRLSDSSGAIDLYEGVVNAPRGERRALAALERLVQTPEHTLRITHILEPLYRELGEWRKLVAVLEAQVELVPEEAERVRLLSEVGELHEQRGRDPSLSFAAYSRALVIDPSNDSVRAHVDRLAAVRGAWDDLVTVYEAALAVARDQHVIAQMLATLARVHDEKRGDPRAAITAYERLAQSEPDDPAPLDALESLHVMVGDWGGLASVLARRVDQAYSPAEKAELLRRLGQVQEEVLGDRSAAIEAYERATREDDMDAAAYEALDRLYTREKRIEELTRVVGRRIDLTSASADRIALAVRLGALLDVSLRRSDDAIAAYRRALDEDPAHRPALQALRALLEREGRWPDVLDLLAQESAAAVDEAERVSLAYRAGEVLEKRLDDAGEAIERYAEALGRDPNHLGSIEALLRISGVAAHRERAAELLEPVLRAGQRWDALITLLEGGLEALEDPLARKAELSRIAEAHLQGRNDPRAAFAALRRALAEDPGDDQLTDELERHAQTLGDFRELADALSAQASHTPDPQASARLFKRLGRIAERELGDDSRAVDAYLQASERDDDASETLAHLDRLFVKTERFEELLDVLERRVAASLDPAERADLLVRLGALREERFDDGRGALVAFKEVLDGDPADPRALAGLERLGHRDALALEVLEILDRCYRDTGATEKLAELYDLRTRLAETDAERIRLLREAAVIWERELDNKPRAIEKLRRVVELDPGDDGALDALESLAVEIGSFEGLRGLVEGLVSSGAIEGQRKRELCLRAADWYRDRLDDAESEERCVRWALALDVNQIELHERLLSLLAAPGRERDRVLALRELAAATKSPETRRERLEEAARLYEGALSDPEGAAATLQLLLDADPKDEHALAELDRIRSAQGRQRDVIGLLERRIALSKAEDQQIALRERLAAVLSELGEQVQAVSVLREIVARRPEHGSALDALDRLYAQAEQYEALRELLESRLRHASAEDGARIRKRLARLVDDKLHDRKAAIELYAEVLDQDPDDAQADAELERLLLVEKRLPELVEHLLRRADRAAETGEPVLAVRSLRQAAQLLASELGDSARAIECYERARALAPEDKPILEALVRAYEASEQWSLAADRLEELVKLEQGQPRVALAHELARIADEELASVERAERALLAAREVDASDASTTSKLRELYEKHRAFEKLASLLSEQEAALTDPKEKVTLLLRVAAVYREQLGDPARAAGQLERAIKLVPDDRDVLMQLCDLYIEAGRSQDAIPVLEKLVASYGGRRAKEVAVYEHKLGQAYEGLSQLDEALKHYDAAFKVDLTSVPILRDLGRLCMTKGDYDRAQKTYRALLLQKLGEGAGITKADVYYRLGEISFRQGDKLKAKSMLERAIAEGGGHAEAKALLEQC